MAEIKPLGRYAPLVRLACVIAILFLVHAIILAQEQSRQASQTKKTVRKKIELIYADDGILLKDKAGNEMHHFTGMVQFRHNEITMTCDSAHYSPSKDQVTAFSRIHIEQGDTLDLFGDYLFYDGQTEIAIVRKTLSLSTRRHTFIPKLWTMMSGTRLPSMMPEAG